MSTKGENLAVSNKKWQNNHHKDKDGTYIVSAIRYGSQGSCHGPTKKGNGSYLMKSEDKQDKDDFTYQSPPNGSLGGWSHDQLPKMVKNKSCSPAL